MTTWAQCQGEDGTLVAVLVISEKEIQKELLEQEFAGRFSGLGFKPSPSGW